MDQEIEEIAAWLKKRAAKKHLAVVVYTEAARRKPGWIILPVRIDGEMGAYECAVKLQKLEDEWDRQNTRRDLHLFLEPGSGPPSKIPVTTDP